MHSKAKLKFKIRLPAFKNREDCDSDAKLLSAARLIATITYLSGAINFKTSLQSQNITTYSNPSWKKLDDFVKCRLLQE